MRRRISKAAIELVGLAGSESKYPKQLSGGMKMRASLARSLAMQPKVFLFDEPFAAVDEITRERLNDELMRLFNREHFAGLFITHSISEAVFLSTRVLVMSPMVTAMSAPPGLSAIRRAMARLSSIPDTECPRRASGTAIRPVPIASSSTGPAPASESSTSTTASIAAGSFAPPGTS